MGASASIDNDVNMDDDNDHNAWMILNIMTDDGARFNSRKLFIAGSSDSSLLESQEDRIYNKGYWWEHDHVPTEKDDEDNINQVLPMTHKKLESFQYLVKQAGLDSSYSEHFACPSELVEGSIYITVRFICRQRKSKQINVTSVSGVLPYSQLIVPFAGCVDKVTRGAWMTRARELLPGPRFETVHYDLRSWWAKVEKLCEEACSSRELTARRSEFFSFATKRSQAYAHAVQQGMGTVKGQEHLQMVETWKEEGEKALEKVSACLLDKLFNDGKVLIAEVVKDKAVAFQKLECLKKLLHDEFMHSLLTLGDQIEVHEHDAWASFHLRFSADRRMSTSVQPRRMGRKQSVMLIKEKFASTANLAEKDKTKQRKSIMINDPLLGRSFRKLLDEDTNPASKTFFSQVPTEPVYIPISSSSPQPSPSKSISPSKRSQGKKGLSRTSTAPLAEDENDKVIEDRVKSMIITMTASATQNTTKAKLTKRLSLVKANKVKHRNESFMIGAKAHFECLLFDLCINAKMLDYMDRERDIMENKLMNQIAHVKKAQSIKHSKDLGQAIKGNAGDKEVLALEVDLQRRKEKLHNRLTHRKMRKRKEFDDARRVTLDMLKEKLESINRVSTTANLTPTGTAKVKGVSLIYKAMQE